MINITLISVLVLGLFIPHANAQDKLTPIVPCVQDRVAFKQLDFMEGKLTPIKFESLVTCNKFNQFSLMPFTKEEFTTTGSISDVYTATATELTPIKDPKIKSGIFSFNLMAINKPQEEKTEVLSIKPQIAHIKVVVRIFDSTKYKEPPKCDPKIELKKKSVDFCKLPISAEQNYFFDFKLLKTELLTLNNTQDCYSYEIEIKSATGQEILLSRWTDDQAWLQSTPVSYYSAGLMSNIGYLLKEQKFTISLKMLGNIKLNSTLYTVTFNFKNMFTDASCRLTTVLEKEIDLNQKAINIIPVNTEIKFLKEIFGIDLTQKAKVAYSMQFIKNKEFDRNASITTAGVSFAPFTPEQIQKILNLTTSTYQLKINANFTVEGLSTNPVISRFVKIKNCKFGPSITLNLISGKLESRVDIRQRFMVDKSCQIKMQQIQVPGVILTLSPEILIVDYSKYYGAPFKLGGTYQDGTTFTISVVIGCTSWVKEIREKTVKTMIMQKALAYNFILKPFNHKEDDDATILNAFYKATVLSGTFDPKKHCPYRFITILPTGKQIDIPQLPKDSKALKEINLLPNGLSLQQAYASFKFILSSMSGGFSFNAKFQLIDFTQQTYDINPVIQVCTEKNKKSTYCAQFFTECIKISDTYLKYTYTEHTSQEIIVKDFKKLITIDSKCTKLGFSLPKDAYGATFSKDQAQIFIDYLIFTDDQIIVYAKDESRSFMKNITVKIEKSTVQPCKSWIEAVKTQVENEPSLKLCSIVTKKDAQSCDSQVKIDLRRLDQIEDDQQNEDKEELYSDNFDHRRLSTPSMDSIMKTYPTYIQEQYKKVQEVNSTILKLSLEMQKYTNISNDLLAKLKLTNSSTEQAAIMLEMNKNLENMKLHQQKMQPEMEKLKLESAKLNAMMEKYQQELAAKQKAEAERIAKEKAEAERIAKEKAEAERIAKEKAEAERLAKEKAEAERLAKEKAEAERIAKEKEEAARIAKEKAIKEAAEAAKKKAEEEAAIAAKKKAEEAAALAKKKAEEAAAAKKKAEEAAAAKKKAEEEAAAAKKKAEEEAAAAKKKAEEEEKKINAGDDLEGGNFFEKLLANTIDSKKIVPAYNTKYCPLKFNIYDTKNRKTIDTIDISATTTQNYVVYQDLLVLQKQQMGKSSIFKYKFKHLDPKTGQKIDFSIRMTDAMNKYVEQTYDFRICVDSNLKSEYCQTKYIDCIKKQWGLLVLQPKEYLQNGSFTKPISQFMPVDTRCGIVWTTLSKELKVEKNNVMIQFPQFQATKFTLLATDKDKLFSQPIDVYVRREKKDLPPGPVCPSVVDYLKQNLPSNFNQNPVIKDSFIGTRPSNQAIYHTKEFLTIQKLMQKRVTIAIAGCEEKSVIYDGSTEVSTIDFAPQYGKFAIKNSTLTLSYTPTNAFFWVNPQQDGFLSKIQIAIIERTGKRFTLTYTIQICNEANKDEEYCKNIRKQCISENSIGLGLTRKELNSRYTVYKDLRKIVEIKSDCNVRFFLATRGIRGVYIRYPAYIVIIPRLVNMKKFSIIAQDNKNRFGKIITVGLAGSEQECKSWVEKVKEEYDIRKVEYLPTARVNMVRKRYAYVGQQDLTKIIRRFLLQTSFNSKLHCKLKITLWAEGRTITISLGQLLAKRNTSIQIVKGKIWFLQDWRRRRWRFMIATRKRFFRTYMRLAVKDEVASFQFNFAFDVCVDAQWGFCRRFRVIKTPLSIVAGGTTTVTLPQNTTQKEIIDPNKDTQSQTPLPKIEDLKKAVFLMNNLPDQKIKLASLKNNNQTLSIKFDVANSNNAISSRILPFLKVEQQISSKDDDIKLYLKVKMADITKKLMKNGKDIRAEVVLKITQNTQSYVTPKISLYVKAPLKKIIAIKKNVIIKKDDEQNKDKKEELADLKKKVEEKKAQEKKTDDQEKEDDQKKEDDTKEDGESDEKKIDEDDSKKQEDSTKPGPPIDPIIIDNKDSQDSQDKDSSQQTNQQDSNQQKTPIKIDVDFSSDLQETAQSIQKLVEKDKRYYQDEIVEKFEDKREDAVVLSENPEEQEKQLVEVQKQVEEAENTQAEPEPIRVVATSKKTEQEKINTFKPTFKFEKVEIKKAENKPVKVVDDKAPPKQARTQPQIVKILMSGKGELTICFSKPMRYAKNWVSKFLKDNKQNDILEELVDSIQAPLPKFLFQRAKSILQVQLPFEDVKITKLGNLCIGFQVSFDSLDDPDTISLTSSTELDKILVEVPKKLIINGQDGESMVLDKKDFDDEDGMSFYIKKGLQPQKIIPKDSSTKGIQSVADGVPSATAAANGAIMAATAIFGGDMQELGQSMSDEQQGSSTSALKYNQPGPSNGFNSEQSASASMKSKTLKMFDETNIAWSGRSQQNEGLVKSGYTSGSTAENMGQSTLATAGGYGLLSTLSSAGGGAMFEGGEENIQERVGMIKQKYKLTKSSAATQTINAFIAMFFLRALLTSFSNSQNEDLLESKNFGSSGNLSFADQFNIILGIILLIFCCAILVALTVQLVANIPWLFSFGKKVQGTENVLKRKTNHRWFLFTMGQYRIFLTAMLIYFVTDPSFAAPQIYMAIVINPANLLLGWQLKPLPVVFGWVDLSKIVYMSEIVAMCILYYNFAMTDVMDVNPKGKIWIGWMVMALQQLKFGLNMVKLGFDQSNNHKSCFKKLKQKLRCCSKKQNYDAIENESRKKMTENNVKRYNKKFHKIDVEEINEYTHRRIAPVEGFKSQALASDEKLAENFYKLRKDRRLREQSDSESGPRVLSIITEQQDSIMDGTHDADAELSDAQSVGSVRVYKSLHTKIQEKNQNIVSKEAINQKIEQVPPEKMDE